jgi:hypothetical protein
LNDSGQCTVPPDLTGVTAVAAKGSHSMVLIDDSPLPSPQRAERFLE